MGDGDVVGDHREKYCYIDRDQNGRRWKSAHVLHSTGPLALLCCANAHQAALRAEVFSGLSGLKLATTVGAVGQRYESLRRWQPEYDSAVSNRSSPKPLRCIH